MVERWASPGGFYSQKQCFLKSSVNKPDKMGSSSLTVISHANALGQAVLPALVQRVLRYLLSAARKVLMRETGSSAASTVTRTWVSSHGLVPLQKIILTKQRGEGEEGKKKNQLMTGEAKFTSGDHSTV